MAFVQPMLPRGKAKLRARMEAPPLRDRIPDNWADFAALTRIRSGGKVIPCA